jgi:hypothetical protein
MRVKAPEAVTARRRQARALLCLSFMRNGAQDRWGKAALVRPQASAKTA